MCNRCHNPHCYGSCVPCAQFPVAPQIGPQGPGGPTGPTGYTGPTGPTGPTVEPIAGQRSNFANYIYAGCGGGPCVGFVDCIQFISLAAGSTGIIETSNDQTSVSSPGVYKIQWRLTIANIPQS